MRVRSLLRKMSFSRYYLRESNPRFPYKSTVNIILMKSLVHMLMQSKNSLKFSHLPAYRFFQIDTDSHWMGVDATSIVSRSSKDTNTPVLLPTVAQLGDQITTWTTHN